MDQRSLMDGSNSSPLSNAFQTYLEWREEAGRQFGATLEAASNGDEAAMQDLAMRFLPGGGIRSVVGRNLAAGAASRSLDAALKLEGRQFAKFLQSVERDAIARGGAARSVEETRLILERAKALGWRQVRDVETKFAGGPHIHLIGPGGGQNLHFPLPPGFVP